MARIDSARSQEIRHLPTDRLILPCSHRRLVKRSEVSPSLWWQCRMSLSLNPKLARLRMSDRSIAFPLRVIGFCYLSHGAYGMQGSSHGYWNRGVKPLGDY